jgi:beta-N-acetylhexosaminidase
MRNQKLQLKKWVKICIIFCFGTFVLNTSVFAQDLFPSQYKQWADSVFNTLSPDAKIGQLLMPRGNYNVNYDPSLLKTWIKEYKVGGFVFFAGSPAKQSQLVNELQEISNVPLLVGMDLEWGLAMRLDSTVRFPYQMTLGAIQDNNQLIFDMGAEIGRQCKRMGVHINYAPVVDVNNNANNPVINFRSFGENKYKAYMKGLQSEGIITSAKHFPGHGDTGTDSHYDLPLINHPKARLDSVELYPYKQLINNGLQGVMIAHLNIPALDNTPNQASTLSKKIVTDLLRKELGFRGLVFTDAMDMKAATKYFPEGTANVKAILAGNDILETLTDIPGAFNAIKYALANKQITQTEIDERVKKILLAKAYAGLAQYKPIKIQNLVKDLNTAQSDVLNEKLARESITVLHNKQELLPIKNLANKKIATLAIGAKDKTEFQKSAELYTEMQHFQLNETSTASQIAAVREALTQQDLILVSLHGTSIRPANNYSIKPEIATLVNEFAKGKNKIVSFFSNLYTLGKFENLQNTEQLIMAYQESAFSQKATAELIFGVYGSKGKLPATVNEHFSYGQGINTTSLDRLGYTLPEALGIDAAQLSAKVDSIINTAINLKATPGAVLLLAKDNKVFYHKAYGHQTYENNALPVQKDNLYDLASITKISSSVPAFMQLADAGKFDLNHTFGTQYPAWKTSNKANLNYKDILAHQSRLRAWIPFWTNAIDSVAMIRNSLIFNTKYKKKMRASLFKRIFNAKKAEQYFCNNIISNAKIWNECINLSQTPIIWKSNTFANTSSAAFPKQVADQLWMHKNTEQQLKKAIELSPLRDKKEYVYSDLSYYIVPEIIQNATGQKFEDYLANTFYKPLGANTLCFNPSQKYPMARIVPTEYDSLYRRTLLHGQVHDEGASMMGGVSGHAGLFGTANDLAKLMTMYLNMGSYGGDKYIEKSTLTNWTTYAYNADINSRRGIGFDKPDRSQAGLSAAASASPASFGHSGFTGTYTWADPANGLLYVFLSNRVYPTRQNNALSQLNVRTNIMEEVYQLLNQAPKQK